jgi:hypothetical protein
LDVLQLHGQVDRELVGGLEQQAGPPSEPVEGVEAVVDDGAVEDVDAGIREAGDRVVADRVDEAAVEAIEAAAAKGKLVAAFTSPVTEYPGSPLATVSALPMNAVSKRSVLGRFGTYFITPPTELAPYKVPCGPRSTSSRATSKVSKSPEAMAALARPLLDPKGTSPK